MDFYISYIGDHMGAITMATPEALSLFVVVYVMLASDALGAGIVLQ